VFTSRKLFFTFLLAVICLLGVLSFAQNAQSPVTTDDLNQFSWRWIGPMSFSGRISAFAVPRGQSQMYYVLTASGGIFKTSDGGTHFDSIFEHSGTGSMGWMAIAPSNQDVLYVGTGEPMHARASTHGNGMWKSTDAGKTWTHIGLEKSQYIPKVEVDSKNPDIVFVAAEGDLYDNGTDSERGLYKSIDGGKTWANVFASVAKDRGVADFVIDPRNSNVIIAAAYRTYRRAWTYYDRWPGNNLYKTLDGGKTWKLLKNGLPTDVELGRTGLAIYEKNPSIIYARLDQAISLGFNERDGAANFRAAGGGRGGGGGGGGGGGFGGAPMGTTLFPEGVTLDQFKAFKINAEIAKLAPKFAPITAANENELVTKLNEMIADKDFLTKNGVDIAKLNQSARKIFVQNAGLIESTNEVEKMMKEPAAQPDSTEAKGRAQILNRHVIDVLYAGVLNVLPPIKRDGAVYRTDDQGETWKMMTEYKQSGGSTMINQTEGGYYGRILVDQTNDQVVLCGDTNVTISKDSGKTFQPSGWDRGNGATHVDHRDTWMDPLNPNHILDGNDGGVCETWDGGKHWSQKNQINAQQFYDVSVDNEQPYNVMGGTQDNGCWLGPSQTRNSYGMFGEDWTYLPTGDGFMAVRDWWNPEYVYYESQFGGSSRENLKTGETSSLAPRLTQEQVAAGEPALRYQWNAPIVLSPHNPGIVYVCSQYVWRSLSHGDRDTFVRVSPDLTKADKAKLAEAKKTNLQWATIYTFAESPKKAGLYWAGTDDGNVQVSTDGGVNWTNTTAQFYDANGKAKPGIKGDLIPYDRWVKRVVPSAFDENTCYVGFSGYRTQNEDKTWLFVTKDLGKTWTDISGNMNNPIFDIEEDPDNANVLYLGTDYGVFLTIDQGKSWTRFGANQPDVTIRDVAIQKRDREMAIGTYGRGIYVADIGPIKEFKPEVFQESAHLFDIKDTIRWSRFERRGDTIGELTKADNPPVGANIYYYLKADAQNVKVTVKDLEGTVIADLTPSAKKGLQKQFWNLQRQVAAAGGPGGAGGRGGGAGGGGGFAGGGRGGRGGGVENGAYKVTLTVDGKEIATKKMTILPDPMFK
jgi:photosystem II stability/assembly factor-like uncharacterized protein